MTDENFYTWEQVLDFLTPEMPFGQFGDQFLERIGLPHGYGGYCLATTPRGFVVVKDQMPVDVRNPTPIWRLWEHWGRTDLLESMGKL